MASPSFSPHVRCKLLWQASDCSWMYCENSEDFVCTPQISFLQISSLEFSVSLKNLESTSRNPRTKIIRDRNEILAGFIFSVRDKASLHTERLDKETPFTDFFCFVDTCGQVRDRGNSLVDNDYSWNKLANMLYVEIPSGVGFSYSDTLDDYKVRLW